MEEGRILDYISIQKPILVLDSEFNVFNDLEVLDKGQIQVEMYLKREWIEDGSMKYGQFEITKAEKVNAKKVREIT